MSITPQRLRQCLNYLRSNGTITSPANFAWKIGISTLKINAVINGTDILENNVANTIAERFPEISATWLITGEGDMISPSAIWTRIDEILKTENQPGLKEYINSIRSETDVSFNKSKQAAAGFAECLHLIYPKYSLSWLLIGKGKMM